ncbi:MAG: DUF4365 domain-containing protein [bacterium]|nr:DUF4365 domain-containing protein [bacterium]
MRASEQEQTGGAGVSEVCAKFERIGWGPVQNQAHDLGTDLLVQAGDRRRFDRGLIVGVQVKAGESWFSATKRDDHGRIIGWWYYEPDAEHFDDWVTHGLPHLIVLHDLDANTSYWAHVAADRVIGTGKGCKILVPASQTVDDDHLVGLLDVASQQKAAPSVEGTAFGASALGIAPGRRLRHALVAPRIVAPHRNRGYEEAIGPEEAIALLAQGRFLDVTRFVDKHKTVPDLQARISVADWRWHFARAFWTWALTDDVSDLRQVFEDAPRGGAQVASGVFLACALRRQERHDDAIRNLESLLESDDLGPVDHGWVLVQRSRLRAELGEIAGARSDAADAQRSFVGDADDVTVSALAAAAAWQLFATADVGNKDVGSVLTAADTAVAWWRSQTILWGLDEASKQRFREWAEDPSTRWPAEDRESLNLFAAELNADLTGEHGTWRAVAELGARHRLMAAARSDDEVDELTQGLDALRRSGEASALKLAVAHLRRVGPVESISAAATRLTFGGWTHTTAQANLEFFAVAGDLVEPDAASGWVAWLAGQWDDPSDLANRVRPTFLLHHAFAEAIAGLLPAAGPAAHRRSAELLVTGPREEVTASAFARWIGWLDYNELTAETVGQLNGIAGEDHGQVGAHLLGWLADHGHTDAKREVVERALAGDLHALSCMGAVTELEATGAARLIDMFEQMVRLTITQAANSSYSFGGFDEGRGLALFNCWFPDIARWDPLVDLLLDQRVAAEDKRAALELLSELADRLPQGVRAALAANIDVIGQTASRDSPGGSTIGGLGVVLGVATGGIKGQAAESALARLALGSVQDRQDAASLLGRGMCESMRPLLASFIADDRASVRRSAANAIGRLAASASDGMVVELAQMIVSDRGVAVPSALVAGLSRGAQSTELGRDIARKLLIHRSATVRRLAARYVDEYGSP